MIEYIACVVMLLRVRVGCTYMILGNVTVQEPGITESLFMHGARSARRICPEVVRSYQAIYNEGPPHMAESLFVLVLDSH